jgi:glycerol-3-phosphate cytidylyltransferase
MGMRIGYAAGAFDLLHVGHLTTLRHARESCDRLIAGVISDEALQATRGIVPVIPTAERAEIVRSIVYVDDVYIETSARRVDAWEDVHFTHFFTGEDWRGTEKGLRLEAELSPLGVGVVYLPYAAHTSSTRLRQALGTLTRNQLAVSR